MTYLDSTDIHYVELVKLNTIIRNKLVFKWVDNYAGEVIVIIACRVMKRVARCFVEGPFAK